MKKYLIILNAILLFGTSDINAQLADRKIDEMSLKSASRYAVVLTLSPTQELAMSQIFFKYDRKLSNQISNPKTYAQVFQLLQKDKNAELQKILGARGFKNYQLFEQIERSSAVEYYDDIVKSVKNQDSLKIQLSTYFLDQIFPVLSLKRALLDEKISIVDIRIISQIRDSIYNSFEIDMETDSLISTNIIRDQTYYNLINYADKYYEAYHATLQSIEPFVTKWKKDLGEIMAKYYTPDQLRVFNAADQDLAKRGLLTTIDSFGFFMMEPNNRPRFFKNLRLLQVIKERLIYTK